MIPQTLGALVLFLLLVPPGLVLEMYRRRRRRPKGEVESAFWEVSRVAVGSLVFSLIATLLLLGVQKAGAVLLKWDYYVDVEEFARRGVAYAQQHVFLLVGTAVSEVALASGLALAFARLLARRDPFWSRSGVTAWWRVFRLDRPIGTLPWVHVHLDDGTSFYGFLHSYSTSDKMDEREIILYGTQLTYVGKSLDGEDGVTKDVIGQRWDRVVIPGSHVRYVRVQYLDAKTGKRVESSRQRGEDPPEGDDDGEAESSAKPASTTSDHSS